MQRVVHKGLQKTLLYLAYYLRLAGHPCATKMYQTLRKFFYWHLMANYMLETARRRAACAKISEKTGAPPSKMEAIPCNHTIGIRRNRCLLAVTQINSWTLPYIDDHRPFLQDDARYFHAGNNSYQCCDGIFSEFYLHLWPATLLAARQCTAVRGKVL